jgi:hypothetical protein
VLVSGFMAHVAIPGTHGVFAFAATVLLVAGAGPSSGSRQLCGGVATAVLVVASAMIAVMRTANFILNSGLSASRRRGAVDAGVKKSDPLQ